MIRTVTLALLAASLLIVGTAVARNTSNLTRRDIRAMPILERPSRPGHFYGNTVRRNHSRAVEMQGIQAAPATVWEGYSQSPQSNAWIEQNQTSSYSE